MAIRVVCCCCHCSPFVIPVVGAVNVESVVVAIVGDAVEGFVFFSGVIAVVVESATV